MAKFYTSSGKTSCLIFLSGISKSREELIFNRYILPLINRTYNINQRCYSLITALNFLYPQDLCRFLSLVSFHSGANNILVVLSTKYSSQTWKTALVRENIARLSSWKRIRYCDMLYHTSVPLSETLICTPSQFSSHYAHFHPVFFISKWVIPFQNPETARWVFHVFPGIAWYSFPTSCMMLYLMNNFLVITFKHQQFHFITVAVKDHQISICTEEAGDMAKAPGSHTPKPRFE